MAEGWSRSFTTRDSEISHLQSSVSTPCWYFKEGNCRFGENCRYLHESGPCSSRIITNSNLMSIKNDHNSKSNEGWVNAPEFIPSSIISGEEQNPDEVCVKNPTETISEPKSYARALDPNAGQTLSINKSASELCPYYMMGCCRYGDECAYIHGDVCEFCGQHCLHPTDEAQRQQHHQDCMRQHEADMEQSFAVARSRDKICGICMEIIWEKIPATKQRFGLLPNCSHCFCLDCIRTWRQAKQFENKIIRSCPECRVQSDFICPSRFWCDSKEDKEKLIEDYKKALSKKDCKYFNQGRGECPFGNKCFYRHALPDGTVTDVGPPQGKHRRRRIGHDSEEGDVVRLLLWDFLEERESRLYLQLGLDYDEIDELLFPSDSDDGDSDDTDSIFYFH